MSWHPSRASTAALDPAHPSRYRAAVVRGCSGRSMLVETDDGDERLVALPVIPEAGSVSLVGSRVLLSDDDEWVVSIQPTDPTEAVVIDLGDGTRAPAVDIRPAPPAPRDDKKTAKGLAGRLAVGRRRRNHVHLV